MYKYKMEVTNRQTDIDCKLSWYTCFMFNGNAYFYNQFIKFAGESQFNSLNVAQTSLYLCLI